MISLLDILFGSVVHGPSNLEPIELPNTGGGGQRIKKQRHVFIDDDGVRTTVEWLYANECLNAGTATFESMLEVNGIVHTFYTFHPPRSK